MRFTSAIIRVSAIISSSLWPGLPYPLHTTRFFVSSFPAKVELKSHKERVPFLAAVSFEAHLSPLISILMVYSSRSVDDLGLCAQTFPALLGLVFVPVHARIMVCTWTGTFATRAHLGSRPVYVLLIMRSWSGPPRTSNPVVNLCEPLRLRFNQFRRVHVISS